MNTITGFDGSTIRLFSRVEMHPGTDQWMRGARFGTVININPKMGRARVKLDRLRSGVSVTSDLVRSIDEEPVL